MEQLILASASPRRVELMKQMGLTVTVCPAVGEEKRGEEEPAEMVEKLSLQKALEVAEKQRERCVVIGADTMVAQGGQMLGKPRDEVDAEKILQQLSGKAHEVYTGVTCILWDGSRVLEQQVFSECTRVFMATLSQEEIRCYLATGEPMDKAGAYGIQGRGAVYIERIEGDYYNVVGLPVSALYHRLKKYLT